MDMKLNMNKQFSLSVKDISSTLACDRKIVASWLREVSLPFTGAKKTWIYFRKLEKGQKDD